MGTLAYFASGINKEAYCNLNFEKIYLIDNCFSEEKCVKGKIICLGMDCLDSIQYLKDEGVKIDCFVSLNEGLFEGGGSYPIHSDVFLGYAMQLFNDNYIHIIDESYYSPDYRITMDLPYEKEEICNTDPRYISLGIFTERDVSKARVYQMRKLNAGKSEIKISDTISVSVIHDTIWNYYDKLDCISLSFSEPWQQEFFKNFSKVINIYGKTIEEILSICESNKILRIGFTPWSKGKYLDFISRLRNLKCVTPIEIFLFHLNIRDYNEVKKAFKVNKI